MPNEFDGHKAVISQPRVAVRLGEETEWTMIVIILL